MIDILLATYNSHKFLTEQLDSIIAQDYSNWRIIARDGGSSDKTLNILQKYQKKLGHEKFIIINNDTQSSALENFCELLRHASSEYIMFCDHDDVWFENKISLSLNNLQAITNQKQPLLVFSDKKIVDQNLNILDESFFHYLKLNPDKLKINNLIVQNVASGCTMLFNQKLLQLLNIESMEKYAVMHDHWISLVAILFGEVSFLRQSTMLYRQHSKNVYGAANFNKKIRNFLIKPRQIRHDYIKYCYQCEGILNNYKKKITNNSSIILEEFANIPKNNYFKKVKVILRYKIFKHGFWRNIGIFIVI